MSFSSRKTLYGFVLLVALGMTGCGGGAGNDAKKVAAAPIVTSAPTVSSTSPPNNATGIAVNAAVTATFSQNMDASTVNATSFTLMNGANGVAGSVYANGTTAAFAPSSNLAYSTTYTAIITTGVKDAAGNALASNRTWTFTTGTAQDTSPPTVAATSPSNNATGIAVNAAITATFSENMSASTVTNSTFSLNNGATGVVTYNGTTATFTPSVNLAYSTTYTATITTGVRDAAGNAMASNRTWTFTTGTVPDSTPPTVTTTSPANNATGVAVNAAVTATFSENMSASTVTNSTFSLNNGVTGAVTYNGTTATFTPSANLAYSTTYTATITTGVKDAAGNAMASNRVWTFTTQAAPPSGTVRILYLHHSTGGVIWGGGVPGVVTAYNTANGTNYVITELAYPTNAYPWNNYPYDYWNLWVNNTGASTALGEPNLDMLAQNYDVIVFKHCYPVSGIEADSGTASVSSETKSLQNYYLQYAALKTRMLQFPTKKFIVWTGAALRAVDTTVDQANRSKTFFDWVKGTWDQPGDNIFVWDFYTLETEGGIYLTTANASGTDSHPNSTFAVRVAPFFVKRLVDVIEGRGDSGSITGN